MDRNPSRERSQAAELAPRVSAIVVTRFSGRTLELCLRSALAEPWVDELVIVDAGNPPAVSSALRALQADRRDVALVATPHDGFSFPHALNLGAARARGRWLLFIDPHVVLQRGAAERMVAGGGGMRSPWIIGGRLTDTEGKERWAARGGALTAWSALAVALDWRGKKPRRRRKGADPEEPLPVAAVSGAFMLMPAADFHDLGGFDEGFVSDAADLDLCRRAGDAGGVVLFQPAASGVQFMARMPPGRKEAQGLARFAAKSARSPLQRAFAAIARPALLTVLGLRALVAGRPPRPRWTRGQG